MGVIVAKGFWDGSASFELGVVAYVVLGVVVHYGSGMSWGWLSLVVVCADCACLHFSKSRLFFVVDSASGPHTGDR